MANERLALRKDAFDVLYYEMVPLLEKKAASTAVTPTDGRAPVYFTDSPLDAPWYLTNEELHTLLGSGDSVEVTIYWESKCAEVRHLLEGETPCGKEEGTPPSECPDWEKDTTGIFYFLSSGLRPSTR